MDPLTIIGITGVIIGIVAGIVQIVDYLQKRREQRTVTTPVKPLPAAAIPTDDSLAQLRQQLTTLFNESELRNLYFDLGVDYESLPARSKDGKARELIAHMQRNSRLPELIRMGRQLRPQVPWSDLPHEPTPDPFPKLSILHNLPRRRPFVGREAEKAQVHEALLADGYLVSIEGIGGIGKSSLALQVAHECLQAGLAGLEVKDIATFEGVIWVTAKDQELSLEGMLNMIAGALEYAGIAQLPLEEKQVAVQKLLRAKQCLLIVDNYETVTDTSVHQFLRELPEPSKALITTRIQNTPQAHIVSLRGMIRSEALTLMRSDGQRLGLPTVAQADDGVLLLLYEATGGAPLALKWALGQIKQKGQSLDLVLSALREARGSIFETIFARAWNLLSDEAQRVLLVMPIFATSADRPDIEAASGVQGNLLDESLGQLVEMTLIDVTVELGISLQRYGIHPLTRAFTFNRLVEIPNFEEESRMRLAKYYIARSQEKTWLSRAEEIWYEDELVNIVALLEWANKAQKWDVITNILTSAQNFYWQKRVDYNEIMLKAATTLIDLEKLAFFQKSFGWVLYKQRRYPEAQILYESAIHQFLRLKKTEEAAQIMINLAKLYIAREEYSNASQTLDGATELLNEDEYVKLSPGLLATRGNIAYKQGNFSKARNLLEQAIKITEKLDKKVSIGSHKRYLGYVALAENKLEEAAKLFTEALENSQEVMRKENIAKAQLGLARVYAKQGENKKAIVYAQGAKGLFEQLLMENEVKETEQLLQELVES